MDRLMLRVADDCFTLNANPQPPMTDEELIRSALAGGDASFAELVQRHKGKVFGMASRFAGDAHQLDDIAQEIFIRAWRNLAKFRADAPFEHWLARIATHACYDFLRGKQRRGNLVPIDEQRESEIPDKHGSSAAEAREILSHAMQKLSPEEHIVITLTELEEKSVREVAELTGWSESNVKVRAFRARQTLRKILEATYER
jgi:RNA polymerase sigma-70 factor (ECF subfamily)